jgi:hypothetical protein
MARPKWIRVTKLAAAKRQVRQAIELWFANGDPVSIHTLLYAAVEIIHHLHGRVTGKPLFFGNEAMQNAKPETVRLVRDWPNFFKHGRRDADKVLYFNANANLILFSASVAGLTALGEGEDRLIKAFTLYCLIHHPEMFTKEVWYKHHEAALAVLDFEVVPKKQFLHKLRVARRRLRRWGLAPI